MTRILGISAYYHDSAACLLVDGELIAAAQEERFTRVKHDSRFPTNAVRYCLEEAGVSAGQLDCVGFYDKPILKFDRLLETYIDYAPAGLTSFLTSMPSWMTEKIWLAETIRIEIARAEGEPNGRPAKRRAKRYPWRVLFGDHHESHAASAFYPSPFEEAAILTMDGVGEWASASIGVGRGNELTLLEELRFPDSLGLLYSAFTYYTGFTVNSGEYKVMGLAPYGEPTYVSLITDTLLDLRPDGSLRMNREYFGYGEGLRMTSPAFHRLFGGAPRRPGAALTQRDFDLARSIQTVTEEVMLRMAQTAHRETGLRHLCMAGGVALNCVGNGRILREGPFDDVWIQPAAGDAGGAAGIALALWHRYLGQPRHSPERAGHWVSPRKWSRPTPPPYEDGMKGAYLGPRHTEEQIEVFLRQRTLPYRKYPRAQLAPAIADLLAAQNVVGLHQGRMEFGPRALGNRSILADPRSPHMQSAMNRKIKFRESFRPFAPSVQREHVAEWFDVEEESPYMLLVGEVAGARRHALSEAEHRQSGLDRLEVVRSQIPAVTHIDYSARIQTVRREANPLYWEILEAFRLLTGCPVLVNTSFNVRGEPIVCAPLDSWRCFMRTAMDALVLETCVLLKADQPAWEDTPGPPSPLETD